MQQVTRSRKVAKQKQDKHVSLRRKLTIVNLKQNISRTTEVNKKLSYAYI